MESVSPHTDTKVKECQIHEHKQIVDPEIVGFYSAYQVYDMAIIVV